jgi:HD-GYP domain-containing protein (c-di-GMP phosphodiesterase class II)
MEPADLGIKSLRARLATERRATIFAFSQLLDLKDLNTGVHSTRLAEWGVRLGRELGLADARLHDLEIAAVLHDVGKIGVPDAILRKPGPLTRDERSQMQKHAEYGWRVLHLVPAFERASLFVLHHHEAFDGTGYPAGLCGDETPVESRIVALIDAFDAMISSRPYRTGLPIEEAVGRLERAAGTQFDPQLTSAFVGIATTGALSVFEGSGTSLTTAL